MNPKFRILILLITIKYSKSDTCISYNPEKTQCLQCQKGFYLNKNQPGNTCILCDLNCKTCKDYSGCVECSDGYFPKGENICEGCDSSCKTCRNKDSCDSCFNPYDVLFKGKCMRCNYGSYFDLDEEKCKFCNLNCRYCLKQKSEKQGDSKIVCTVCKGGYFQKDGECFSCPKHCSYCGDNGHCQQCAEGFFIDDKGNCSQCSKFCLSCNSKVICERCLRGLYLDPKTRECQSESPFFDYLLNLAVFTALIFLIFFIAYIFVLIGKKKKNKSNYLDKYLVNGVGSGVQEEQTVENLEEEEDEDGVFQGYFQDGY